MANVFTNAKKDLTTNSETVVYTVPASTTGIIKSINSTDTKMYVKDSWLFKQVDNLGQTKNDINIVGLGTTAVTETIKGVTYAGDYGIVAVSYTHLRAHET